jgi:hypothetical protein
MAHNKNGLLDVPPTARLEKLHSPTTPHWHESHTRRYGDLFPHAPALADIMQGGLGDCYLLSALGAIINHPNGPEVIEKCMLDRSSGSVSGEVILRLYDKGLVPRYVKMSKKVASGVGAHGTLWVKLFEKGYAALFGVGGAYKGIEGSAKGGDAEAAYNQGHGAYRAVLGHEAKLFKCSIENDNTFTYLMSLTKENECVNQREIPIVRDEVFGGDEGLVKEWMNWYTCAKYKGWQAVIATSQVYRRHDWEKFLQCYGTGMPQDAQTAISSWINAGGILPGKRGSGQYAFWQRKRFTDIKDALAAQKPVSVATYEKVAKPEKMFPKKGHAGEGLAWSGIVGLHAYAVLATRTDTDGLCWVQLRNPWGDWGVKYEKGTYKEGEKEGRQYLRPVVDRGAGIFEVELSDLCKRFDQITIGTKVE